MRLKYLKKYENYKNYVQAKLDDIFEECTDFINEIKPCHRLLYRGSFYIDYDIERFNNQTNFREPLSTDPIVHELLNEEFLKIFGWKVRNGAFTYLSDTNMNMPFNNYGDDNYIIFPVNGYKYCWSPKITDMFGEYTDYMNGDIFFNFNEEIYKEKIEDWISELKIDKLFKDNDICKAKIDNEISFKGDYYLINKDYKREIIKRIWG